MSKEQTIYYRVYARGNPGNPPNRHVIVYAETKRVFLSLASQADGQRWSTPNCYYEVTVPHSSDREAITDTIRNHAKSNAQPPNGPRINFKNTVVAPYREGLTLDSLAGQAASSFFERSHAARSSTKKRVQGSSSAAASVSSRSAGVPPAAPVPTSTASKLSTTTVFPPPPPLSATEEQYAVLPVNLNTRNPHVFYMKMNKQQLGSHYITLLTKQAQTQRLMTPFPTDFITLTVRPSQNIEMRIQQEYAERVGTHKITFHNGDAPASPAPASPPAAPLESYAYFICLNQVTNQRTVLYAKITETTKTAVNATLEAKRREIDGGSLIDSTLEVAPGSQFESLLKAQSMQKHHYDLTTARFINCDLPQDEVLPSASTSATIQFKSSAPPAPHFHPRAVDGDGDNTREQMKIQSFSNHFREIHADGYTLSNILHGSGHSASADIMQGSKVKGRLTYTPNNGHDQEALTATKIPEQEAFKIIAATMIKMNPTETTFRIFLREDKFADFKAAFDEVARLETGHSVTCEQDDSMKPASGYTFGA